MKQIHGIADAKKIAMVTSDCQDVLVEDGDGIVRLYLQSSAYPAGLTPAQAEFIADLLKDSAARVRKKRPTQAKKD